MVSITIVGRLTKDSELRYLQSGDPILGFSVATDRGVKKGSEWVKEPSYWTCSLWGKRGESLAQYMTKGTQVAVSGEAYSDNWEKDNIKHTQVKINANEVMLLGSKQAGQTADKPKGDLGYGTAPASRQQSSPQPPLDDHFVDEIPF
jgi:single-strand DNA-binding protein